MVKRIIAIQIIVLLILSACASNDTTEQNNNEQDPTLTKVSVSYGQETSQRVEELIKEEHDFNEVIAINNGKLVIVGVDPKQHDRFQLKDLRKSLEDTIEPSVNGREIELSTDQKIILELTKLRERLVDQDMSKKELTKELERIQELAKEQT